MNTIVVVDGTGEDVAPWFAEAEAILSRFRTDSALAQLNRSAGRWTMVPPLLFEATKLACVAAAATDGAFDPTVLAAVESAGYGQSFELGPTPQGPAQPAGRWQEIRLEPRLQAIWLPSGVGIDLGGIGKGLTVDSVMDHLAHVPHLVVNAGGDLGLRTAPGEAPVLVEVANPWEPTRTYTAFSLYSGGVATSSTLGRRWGNGLHHIINPTTGLPATTDLVAATVVADSTAWADALAKACIVLGQDRALQLLQKSGCEAVLFTVAGEAICTPRLEGYRHGYTGASDE